MNSKPEFVHLHNHSEYSLLDGLIRLSDPNGGPSELLKSLSKSGAKGFGLTDHGNMYGAVEFYSNCVAVGLNPIVGCEMYLSKTTRAARGHSQKENCHLTVLARNFEGYQNLMQLATLGFTEGYYYDPRIDKELLAKHAKGLVVLSGCLKSELSQEIAKGNLENAMTLAGTYRDILEPGSFFLEIMDHGIAEQRQATKAVLEIHERTKIPLVATNDCHYTRSTDFDAHDARVCIATGRKLEETNRLKFESHDFYVKTPEEMHKLFGSWAPEALANTLKIAEMCRLKIPMEQMLLPEFPVPEGQSQDSYLEELCVKGLRERFGDIAPAYAERLRYELSIIRKMGFSGYFLIVWDFIAYARTQGIPVGPGRGSGAGALVAYALRITNVDPIKHNLLFERFLNPDRKSMPDLDIDFADTGRDRVIEYVRGKYGAANVAQIITFGSLGAKLVVRDVGRVMGVALSETDRIAKLIPVGPDVSLYKAMQSQPELVEAAKDPQIKKLLELSLKLEGLKRHTGVHAAGTVITKEPVVNYAPLSKGTRSEVVTTQYDGNILPRLGLLKVDFLGLRTLSIIDDAVRFIRARGIPGFNIDELPPDDAKTFELLRAGSGLAVFQLDSQGMRDLLRRLKPSDFNDIVSLIALFRPGPMQSGMLDEFVERKHGKKKIAYDHARLEPILKDTYGCMVFQEQVMEISKRVADFTPGQADSLRKAMGKKIPEELERLRDTFVSGAGKNKISAKLANKIYDQMVQFGGYGFNKSHSAAYGLVAYQTAYLKANHPLEFMCAVATSEIGHSAIGAADKENKLVTYLEEAKRMGLKILPPDAQKSQAAFSIEDPSSIRFGLVAIKNVGMAAAQSIVEARKSGAFKSLSDFCSRVDLHAANKKVLESLVKAGALDALGEGPLGTRRARLLSSLEETADRQARLREDAAAGQGQLFSAEALEVTVEPAEGTAPVTLSDLDVLKFEKEVLGFYFSGHPLLSVQSQLRCAATHEIAKLSPEVTTPVRVAGIINQVKRMVTKSRGEQWARCTLEDLTGEVNLLIFPRAYAGGLGAELKAGRIIAAAGRLSFGRGGEEEGAAAEIIVEEIQSLETAVSRWAKKLLLRCPPNLDEDRLNSLGAALERHQGRCPVVLMQETPEGTASLEVQTRVLLNQNLLESIESILGEGSWRIESAS